GGHYQSPSIAGRGVPGHHRSCSLRQVTPPASTSSAPAMVNTIPDPAMIVSAEAAEGIATWLSRLPAKRMDSTAARFAGSASVETHDIVSGCVSPKQNPATVRSTPSIHGWDRHGIASRLRRLTAERTDSTPARFARSATVATPDIVSGCVSPKQNPATVRSTPSIHGWDRTGISMTLTPASAEAVHSRDRFRHLD